jgi:putative endonuclease
MDIFFFIYILQSEKDNSLYIGYSSNLFERLNQHNRGKSRATRPFRPYKLIYFEGFIDKRDAKSRERYLKSGWGRRTLKKLLKNFLLDSFLK